MNFLEQESTPRPQVRLPAEQMVREQQNRKQAAHVRAKTAFNPFAAPAHGGVPQTASVSEPTINTRSLLTESKGRTSLLTEPGASHILMNPISSQNQHSYSPLTIAADSASLVSPKPGSISTTENAEGTGAINAGRSTPQSNPLLKDGLH